MTAFEAEDRGSSPLRGAKRKTKMRDKRFRLKQKAKYRNKARKIVKGFISREEFKNSKNNTWQKVAEDYGSYNELVDDWAKDYEKNRKKCSCYMCRNERHNECMRQ